MTAKTSIAIEYRPINKLIIDETNARHLTHSENINAFLLASVTEKGVLQPLLVRPANGGKFSVIDGSQRLAAAKAAKLKEVPTILVDEGNALLSVSMNLSVRQMTTYEKYEGYRQAVVAGLPEDYIQRVLGIDEPTLKTIMAISKLDPVVFDGLRENECHSNVVHAAARVPLEAQRRIWDATMAEQQGRFVEWRIREAMADYFKSSTDFNDQQIETIADYYTALGGRSERGLFPEQDGSTPIRILDPDLLSKAASDFIENAQNRIIETTGRKVVALKPSTDYTMRSEKLREAGYSYRPLWLNDASPEQLEQAAVEAGFQTYADVAEVYDGLEAQVIANDGPEEAKLDEFDSALTRLTAPENAFYVIWLDRDGTLTTIFPALYSDTASTAETNERSTPSSAESEDLGNPTMSNVANARQKAMHAALIQRTMVLNETFGMQWAAYSLYDAARTVATMRPRGENCLSVGGSYWNSEVLKGFVVDHARSELFSELFPPERYEDMAVFKEMNVYDCVDVMTKAVTILQAHSYSAERFQAICSAFHLDCREAWDDLVPNVELAAAWFEQFKKPQLVRYAIEVLDPDVEGIGKVANSLKKGELVDALAKALIQGAPGQPEGVQFHANNCMPLGLNSSAPTEKPPAE